MVLGVREAVRHHSYYVVLHHRSDVRSQHLAHVMTDLVEFLRARLDEDATVAEDADGEGYWLDDGERTGRFLEHHTPARVLADVEAKRAIVELHPIYRGPRLLAVDSRGTDFACGRCHATSSIDDESVIEALGPCDTLLALAQPYAGQPGWQEEWRV